jgi:hypothetical protein
MHMLLFGIVPLHNDALLVSFNHLPSSLRKRSFSVAHEATSAPLAGRHRASRTCATRANVNRRSSLIKASYPLDVLVRA